MIETRLQMPRCVSAVLTPTGYCQREVDMTSFSVAQSGPIVIYDGDCGFCNRAVHFILQHERTPQLTFCARKNETAQRILSAHGIAIDNLDSIALVEGDRVFLYSDASLRLATYLRAPWSWLRLGVLVPRFLRQSMYKLIAKNRQRLSGGSNKCLMPSPEQQKRFL